MKPLLFGFALAASILRLNAEESAYQASLRPIRDRLGQLQVERNDFRKPKPGLPPAEEEEFFRLLGRLYVDDPIGALLQQTFSDIEALQALKPRTAADNALLDTLKDLLAIASPFAEYANSREQAEKYAKALRQFIARRDVNGAALWARKHEQ